MRSSVFTIIVINRSSSNNFCFLDNGTFWTRQFRCILSLQRSLLNRRLHIFILVTINHCGIYLPSLFMHFSHFSIKWYMPSRQKVADFVSKFCNHFLSRGFATKIGQRTSLASVTKKVQICRLEVRSIWRRVHRNLLFKIQLCHYLSHAISRWRWVEQPDHVYWVSWITCLTQPKFDPANAIQ